MRRMIGFLAATALTAVALAAAAAAQSSADPLETCAQKPDAAARLACFDQEMQRRHATSAPAPATAPATHAATPPATNTAPEVTAPPSQADDNVGLAGVQLRKKLREQGIAQEKPKPKPIVAQVQRAVSRPDHRYTLVLDNGQVWEQVDTQQGLLIGAHEPVTITPGVLGSFFLETTRQKYVRVRRLQ